jgi:cytochrome c
MRKPQRSKKLHAEFIMRRLLSLAIVAIAVGFPVMPGICAEAGNSAQGEHAFKKCALCHAKDKTNGIGPSLSGVIGRHAGSVPGFHYSAAMKNSIVVWDEKSLDAFIMAPQKALPGTVMPFPGIPSQEERSDLIAYLETLK